MILSSGCRNCGRPWCISMVMVSSERARYKLARLGEVYVPPALCHSTHRVCKACGVLPHSHPGLASGSALYARASKKVVHQPGGLRLGLRELA